jgi:Fe2+ transport system protein FeoA
MSLYDALKDKELKIINITSEENSKRKLNSLGIHQNDVIVKLNRSKFGPVLIKNLFADSAMLAIGKGLAEKIKVSYED